MKKGARINVKMNWKTSEGKEKQERINLMKEIKREMANMDHEWTLNVRWKKSQTKKTNNKRKMKKMQEEERKKKVATKK